MIFRILNGSVQRLEQVSWLIIRQVGSAGFCTSSGLEIDREFLAEGTRKANSWCNSRYNLCQASDRGRAAVMERHVEIQAISEWI